MIRKACQNAYVLGDVATRTMATDFAQPVSGDNLVVIDLPELAEPIEQQTRISIDGQAGTITRQAVDGRVLVKFDDDREQWVDLAATEYLWL